MHADSKQLAAMLRSKLAPTFPLTAKAPGQQEKLQAFVF